MYRAVIHFDGGCSPNPGRKYGSFSIVFDDLFELRLTRFDLGHGTNNEAEFEALLKALETFKAASVKASVPLITIEAAIFTDSRIVFNWLSTQKQFDPSQFKEERRRAMAERAMKALQTLKQCQRFEVQWNSREVNVERFGH